MAAPKRTKAQRESDLVEISRLYCSGWRQVDIADRLGLDQTQISYDLKAIFADWRKARDGDVTAWTNAELARINTLEVEYWEAWRRSCGEKKRTTTTAHKGKNDAQVTVVGEGLLGNPAFLAGVQWCIERRCKILGIDAPTKIAPTEPDGRNPYMGMTDDRLRAEIVRYALASGDVAGSAALPLDAEREAEPTPA
jgi:hypothetical protein